MNWPLLAAGISLVVLAVAVAIAAPHAYRHWRRWRRARGGPAAAAPQPPAVWPDPGSERIWEALERPRPPYPDWYRPEQDQAAAFGPVEHGAGAVRYFARNMHDHRRGPNHCPKCRLQQAEGGGKL